ncbi:NAD-binding protein [Fredinandcohnia sp. QZ13]|uniref:potassium channel family protein n=1 Tax=Fredinandcohnia sp. QZ13 TaxID=3073144 RepID=UPI002853001A|nr:ion channel [Fredinandcohnia sp. QZ13]MDR4889373.1 NAD-binding protein [Fredinandcohnia sp. QZ13]
MISSILSSFFKRFLIAKLIGIVLLVIIIFGAIIHLIEPENFPTIFDGVWWAIVTAATVGYGDYAPTSFFGRIVGMLLIFIGAGIVTRYFAAISTSTFVTQNAYLEGTSGFHGKKHIIIIGWNERVRETISLLKTPGSVLEILLIDDSLEKNPMPGNHFHFIKGDPTRDEILKQANIQDAEMVLVTADQGKDEIHADMISILTLLAIKGLNPTVYTIVEILTTHQIQNAKRGGADEIIQTNRISSLVMVNSILSHGVSDALLSMLVDLKGVKLQFLDVTFDLIGMTFQKASETLLKEGKILIGIKRNEGITINPPLSLEIRKNDQILILKS